MFLRTHTEKIKQWDNHISRWVLSNGQSMNLETWWEKSVPLLPVVADAILGGHQIPGFSSFQLRFNISIFSVSFQTFGAVLVLLRQPVLHVDQLSLRYRRGSQPLQDAESHCWAPRPWCVRQSNKCPLTIGTPIGSAPLENPAYWQWVLHLLNNLTLGTILPEVLDKSDQESISGQIVVGGKGEKLKIRVNVEKHRWGRGVMR